MLLKVNSYNEGFGNGVRIYINGVHQRFITSFNTENGQYSQFANDGEKALVSGITNEPYVVQSKLKPFDLLRIELERKF